MEFKIIYVLGPLFATVAMYFVGRNMVRKEKGRSIRPLPTIMIFVTAVMMHFLIGEGSLLDRVSLLLLDFGIGMIIDAGYLYYHRVHPKVFWGLGMFLMLIAAVVYSVGSMFGFFADGFKYGFGADAKQEVLMELGPDDTIDEVELILEKYDAEANKAFPDVDMTEDVDLAKYFLVLVPKKNAQGLLTDLNADDENVDQAAMNEIVKLEPEEVEAIQPGPSKKHLASDPLIDQQWWIQPEEVNAVHEYLKGKKPQKKAKVAIVDTGVDSDHEDITELFSKSPGSEDPHGHGTHCAGLAGAATNNGIGMASYNYDNKFVEVMGFQALSKDGSGSHYTIADQIIKAADAEADVISLSLGGYSPTPPRVMVDAVEYALAKGAIVIAAAGNSRSKAKYHSPANIKGVICVAALDQNWNKASFSNTNSQVGMPIAAPGVDILSLKTGGGYVNYSGTSMATPIVAGLLGIMRSFDPSMDANEAYNVLVKTGKEIKDKKDTGNCIQPYAAIKFVAE